MQNESLDFFLMNIMTKKQKRLPIIKLNLYKIRGDFGVLSNEILSEQKMTYFWHKSVH